MNSYSYRTAGGSTHRVEADRVEFKAGFVVFWKLGEVYGEHGQRTPEVLVIAQPASSAFEVKQIEAPQ